MIPLMSRPNSQKNCSAWRSAGASAALLTLLSGIPWAVAAEPEEAPPPSLPEPSAPSEAAPPPPPASAPSAPPAAPARPVAAPAPSAPAAPAAAPAADRGDSLRSIEQRVADLKDQVFRARARLTLLSERFLRSTPGGGHAVVVHQNKMGRLFVPVRITYQLDGREVFSKGEDGGQKSVAPASVGELQVWDGGLKPGDHTLSVSVVYRGSAAPVLPYYNQYTYTASAAQRFTASDGGTTRIQVLCREQGNPVLTDVADRPLIEFKVEDSVSQQAAGAKVAAKVEAEKRAQP